MAEVGGLPKFVEKEFEAYLSCGQLSRAAYTQGDGGRRDCETHGNRLLGAFQKAGRASPWDEAGAIDEVTDPMQAHQPVLFACYHATAAGVGVSGERAGQPPLRLMVSPSAMTSTSSQLEDKPDAPVATALGVNLYAKPLVDGRDRVQLEQLCRYFLHPPLSQERLGWREDGRLLLTLKHVWNHGTRALTLESALRLGGPVPIRRAHRHRYYRWRITAEACQRKVHRGQGEGHRMRRMRIAPILPRRRRSSATAFL